MYGRNVFHILQKKGIPTKDRYSYGTNECPSDEVYQSAQNRRLSSFSRIHTIDGVKHVLWKMAWYSLPCLYTIMALPSGRATMTRPMIFMQLLLRVMTPTVSSLGTPGSLIGTTMVAATCHLLTGEES